MLTTFLAGAVAGYGIAIPVGAIAVLIIQTGMRRGLAVAAAAGLGAATADGIYAAVAVLAGSAAVGLLEPIIVPLRFVAAAVLAWIGARAVLAARRSPGVAADECCPPSSARTFAQILGLTLLNPMTVAYFAALVIGLGSLTASPPERAAFVAGAFLASLSWQTLLAFAGSLLHRRPRPALQRLTGYAGGAIILTFAVKVAVDALAL